MMTLFLFSWFKKKLFKKYDQDTSVRSDDQNILYPRVKDILILPKSDNTVLDKKKREIIYAVLEKYKVFGNLKGYKKYFIRVSDQSKHDTTVIKAYNIWLDPFFSSIESSFGLPRKNSQFLCPTPFFLVRLDCINKYTTSYRDGGWGFSGYVLNMLIDPQKREIFDARGEKAN